MYGIQNQFSPQSMAAEGYGWYWKHIDLVQASEYIFAALHLVAFILY